MNVNVRHAQIDKNTFHRLTEAWGSRAAVSLYLDRCQVDTPVATVAKVWQHVFERRPEPIASVVDFGAGDGRFARHRHYLQYRGYEIDPTRFPREPLPQGASLVHQCAFSKIIDDADLCIGNPPYVRNQDLPTGWRQQVADSLFARTGVRLSGLANAWQYFFLLGLASTKCDGMVALVIPYEWVSRPSVTFLREYIRRNCWGVSVYRLRDETFQQVLTTSSITIIDKSCSTGSWQYLEEREDGGFRALPSPAESSDGVVDYLKRSKMDKSQIFAKRGLSPGTQRVLVLTEGERVRHGLRMNDDVVPCITSFRHLDTSCIAITSDVFAQTYRRAGLKCWLVRTDKLPSRRLRDYLSGIPENEYQTVTCLQREEWWKFLMPEVPPILAATGFRGDRPKVALNCVNARAVGSVAGIYGVPVRKRRDFVRAFQGLNLADRIVPHSNGLKKLEIHQINALIEEMTWDKIGRFQ